MSVVDFPGKTIPKLRRELASYLRDIADAIDADESETEPHAVMLVLTGMTRHELLHAGYFGDDAGFHGAANAISAAWRYARRDENMVERCGPYGTPLRRTNNTVDFAAVRRKSVDGAPA